MSDIVERLQRNADALEPRGLSENWVDWTRVADSYREAAATITALRAELAEVRSRLDAVLASSGARGRFHSLEYSDAVDAAETILARTLAPQPPPAAGEAP